MQDIADFTSTSNGVLSEETTIAIFETYLRLHGPTSEARLTAVLQSANEAAVALACFQMTMCGELIADLIDGEVRFWNGDLSKRSFESVGPIVRRVLAKAMA